MCVTEEKMNILDRKGGRSVTYIANAGVMLCVKNKKIIIDGAVDSLPDGYIPPQKDFAEKLVLAKEPYHNIDYIFTTHAHKDHIDARLALELMKRNRHVKAVGPVAVSRLLTSSDNFRDVLSPQIFTVSLKQHSRIDVVFPDISFSAYRIPHDGTAHSTLENIAYRINISGTTILALGDAAPRMHDFEKASLTEKCDILVCHANMAGQKSGREIISEISPKNLVLVHIRDNETEKERISALCEKYRKDLPKTTVLTTPGETVRL